jgi:putative ATPase
MENLFTNSFFDRTKDAKKRNIEPLAERMRPHTFEQFLGQRHLLGVRSVLRRALKRDQLFSLILWGPPGSGKTTLAACIANSTKSAFIQISAVTSGINDLRRIIAKAKHDWQTRQIRTILFIDEVHRWNKAQQDAFLPHVEDGTIILIGATTENPSFEVIAPLLSRCQVYTLERLSPRDLLTLARRALTDRERGFGKMNIRIEPRALDVCIGESNGDARALLNTIEIAVGGTTPDGKGIRHVTIDIVRNAIQKRQTIFYKKGEEYYNVLSAFIKSMRGSDPDGAIYWLARMLEGGQDPRVIARRMIVFASEDISLASETALPLAVATFHAVESIGLPECALNLAHCAIALALSPKNNATYLALGRAQEDVKKTLHEPVPLHLRNAPTELMKKLGYGKGYKYSHDYSLKSGEQEYLPKILKGKTYYQAQSTRNEKK